MRPVAETEVPSARSKMARARFASPAATLGRRNKASSSSRCLAGTETIRRCFAIGTSLFKNRNSPPWFPDYKLFPFLRGDVLSNCMDTIVFVGSFRDSLKVQQRLTPAAPVLGLSGRVPRGVRAKNPRKTRFFACSLDYQSPAAVELWAPLIPFMLRHGRATGKAVSFFSAAAPGSPRNV